MLYRRKYNEKSHYICYFSSGDDFVFYCVCNYLTKKEYFT